MKKFWAWLRVLSVVVVLGGVVYPPAHAVGEAASQNDLAAQKELLQTQIEATKALQQKDAEAINKRIDDQLTQVGQGVDRFAVMASLMGVAITILLVFGGFIGYRNAKSEAIAEAKNAARDWMNQRTSEIDKKIADLTDQLAQRASQAHLTIDEAARAVESKAAQMMETLQEQIQKPSEMRVNSEALQSALAFVDQRDDELRQTPENSYSFADWNTRAHAAYSRRQFEQAAIFWLKASQIPNAGLEKIAQALFNRAIAQGQLQNYKAAIATYDELIHRFGEAPEAALHQLVAEAMVNKGIEQGELQQSEAAIATYDEVIHRFGYAPEAALRELVATAMVNKGSQQCQLQQFEAAIATCDEVIRCVGEASEATLREHLAMAWNGKGFARLLLAKACWKQAQAQAKYNLSEAQHDLDKAVAFSSLPWGVALGNRAYVRYLQGDVPGAESDFAQALRATKDGGEMLYEDTSKDLEMYSIDEDVGMRELVERLWAAYQQDNKPTSS